MSKKRSSRGKKAQAGNRSRGSASFNPDYTYVLVDLKRIALIAGILILGLIVLSFFI